MTRSSLRYNDAFCMLRHLRDRRPACWFDTPRRSQGVQEVQLNDYPQKANANAKAKAKAKAMAMAPVEW